MLEESKKLYPHWLDKSDNSNLTKHLKIVNNQQRDIRHKLKSIEWSRLLNKPLQIHKTQTEPYKWKIEFEAYVPQLKEVNIYKNPTIVNNKVLNNYKVIKGYLDNNNFYSTVTKEIVDSSYELDEENHVFVEDDYEFLNRYDDLIIGEQDQYYYDLLSKKYYKFSNGSYLEVSEDEVPQTSLIYSESFIDNHSRYFRHIVYDDNIRESIIYKYVIDQENNKQYKTKLSYNQSEFNDNGKYELTNSDDISLYYDITVKKYCVYDDNKNQFVEIDDENIIFVNNSNQILSNGNYYIFTELDENSNGSRIPLIESEDITPIISNDKYVLEVYTWDDFHFLKGFPEIDFIDYNNNNIIDVDERTYDNLSIEYETVFDKEYLTFRVHQYGIKLIEIFKDNKPIHKADFVVEKLGFSNKSINTNFAHVYNYNDNLVYYPFKDTDSLEEIKLDVDEYVWRLPLTEEDKIFDEKGEFTGELKNKYDIEVTYYTNPSKPYDSEYDKILRKTYVCEDSIFYHDVSLDMIGVLFNVPRHSFIQIPSLKNVEEEIDYYNHTYPKYCNSLNEDDYHYQKRLEYYITNYNKIYFPCLELWKYFNIDSELVNRKVILSEQNYSYMRNLESDEDKYINELGLNKAQSFYANNNYVSEEERSVINIPKLKAHISEYEFKHSRNGVLIDDEGNYIKDTLGNNVRIDYDYYVNEEEQYVIKYESVSKTFYWYNTKQLLNSKNIPYYQIILTDALSVVPNTRYQLRFCVKEYPNKDINLKLIYKNRKGDIREVVENVPIRKDYDENINENNELIYNNYNKDWEIECEYICTNFITLDTAQNLEICLESESDFKVSDITLQRVTVNHYDSEYMRTDTDYNSCVYDLYADYNDIPSNIKYDDLEIFNKILNRSLPLAKKGFFNFAITNDEMSENMNLNTDVGIYINNLLDVESGILSANDYKENILEHTYNFNKYVKTGDYEIWLKPYMYDESNIIFDFNVDIKMLVFTEDNHAQYETITLTTSDLEKYYDKDDNCFKILVNNKSDNSMSIRLYRDSNFSFKDFKLIRKMPLTMEEITR